MKKIGFIFAALLLAGCQPKDNSIHGYVEGEFIMISSTSQGVLKTLSVERGQQVKAGMPLFALDTAELIAQRENAAANVRRANAEMADLLKGGRPEEIEVILKQKEQAQVTFQNSQREYERIVPLVKTGAASASSLDNAKAAFDNAKSRVDELNAELKKMNLGARIDQIEVAKATIAASQQLLTQWDKKLKDAAPVALSDGFVTDTYFRPGEFVSMGQPVVNLLPPQNVKIRFYVSQSVVPTIKLGHSIKLTCDGCNAPMTAKITYIAPHTEFTPPAIYSVESRQKLVFLIEAKPDNFMEILRPGLPVDITLAP